MNAKRLRVFLIVSALTLIYSTISYAASGEWVQDDKGWRYLRSNGEYFVCPESGRTVFKEIDGRKYAFDREGYMLYGWVDEYGQMLNRDEEWKEAVYYLGDRDDGALRVDTWEKIWVIDALKDEEDQEYWFYFNASGRKIANTGEAYEYLEKKIDGRTYAFADDGHMLDGWVSDDRYYSSPDDGARVSKGWFKTVSAAALEEGNYSADDESWYYAKGNGSVARDEFLTIGGKRYLFNNEGEMMYGLVYLEHDEDTGENSYTYIEDDVDMMTYTSAPTPQDYTGKSGIYYFGDNDDGSMKTGSIKVKFGGDTYSFKFSKNGGNVGKGVNGRDGSYYYYNGRRLKADKYEGEETFTCFDRDGNVEEVRVRKDGKVV